MIKILKCLFDNFNKKEEEATAEFFKAALHRNGKSAILEDTPVGTKIIIIDWDILTQQLEDISKRTGAQLI